MRRKEIALALVFCMAVTGTFTGCRKTPKEKAVIEKSTDVMLQKEKSNKSTIQDFGDKITDKFKEGCVDFKMDAVVDAGSEKEAPVYEMEEGSFSQDQADAFLKVATEGRDFYAFSDEKTKDWYRERIKLLKSIISNGDADTPIVGKKTAKQLLQESKRAYEKAPEEKEEPASTKFVKCKDYGEQIYGYTKKEDGTTRVIHISNDNYTGQGTHPTQMIFMDKKTNDTSYAPFRTITEQFKNAKAEGITLSEEDAKAKAEQELKDMGIEGFVWDGKSQVFVDSEKSSADYEGVSKELKKHAVGFPCSYGFVFTRKVGGTQLTTPTEARSDATPLMGVDYLENTENSEETQAYDKTLGEEYIQILVNDDGVICFQWNSPYTVKNKLLDNCKILDQNVLKKAIKNHVTSVFGDDEMLAIFDVKKMRMVYRAVKKENGKGTYMLVPFWELWGYEKMTVKGDKEDNDTYQDDLIYSYNAINGAVADE